MDNHPAAIVRSTADLRILAQECKAINARINDQDRKILDEYRQLGDRLIAAKNSVGHGKYGPWLEQHGIPTQRASEAVRLSENWAKLPPSGSFKEALTYCDSIRLCSDPPPPISIISTDADASEEEEEASTPPAAPARAGQPAREPGDEPDEPEEPEIQDAEGNPVPPHVTPAFDTAKELTGLCRELDKVIGKVEGITALPGGRLIRFDSFKQQIKDAKGNLWANRPTHLCPYCHAKAKAKVCEVCRDEGWVARHIWQAAPGNHKEKAK